MFKTFILALACIAFLSCSHVAHVRTSDTTTVFQESNSDNVEVYSVANIGKQYLVVGEVMAAVDAGENSEKPVEKLKVEAAKLGADAIINFRLSFCEGYWSIGILATGTAVKFK